MDKDRNRQQEYEQYEAQVYMRNLLKAKRKPKQNVKKHTN